jgi:hypothetical protein
MRDCKKRQSLSGYAPMEAGQVPLHIALDGWVLSYNVLCKGMVQLSERVHLAFHDDAFLR